MTYRIVLEAEGGFYKDLAKFEDKKSVKDYLAAFEMGRQRLKLGGQDHLSGFRLGVAYSESQAKVWGYEHGLTEPTGKLAVKED